jgi:hypothetical protein
MTYILGYIWLDQEENGDVVTRNGLFLCIFLSTNLWMIEFCPMLQEEKNIFYREREANAVSTFALWCVMGLPTLFCLSVIVFILVVPVYFIAALREGTAHFLILYAAAYCCLAANLFLGHFVAAITPDTMINVLIFPGTTLTVQVFISSL